MAAVSQQQLFTAENLAEIIKTTNDFNLVEYTRQLAFFTECLVAATVLLAIFSFWQIMISRITSKRELRAYVFTNKTELRNYGTSMPIEAVVEIKNFGQTPAYKVRRNLEIFAASYPLNQYPAIEARNAESSMAPDGELLMGPATMSAMLNSQQLGAIQNGTMAIYVHGVIEYQDIFHKKQYTKFRLLFRGNGTSIPIGSILSLTHDETGNESS